MLFVNQMPLLNGLPIYIVNTLEAVWKSPAYVGKLPKGLICDLLKIKYLNPFCFLEQFQITLSINMA